MSCARSNHVPVLLQFPLSFQLLGLGVGKEGHGGVMAMKLGNETMHRMKRKCKWAQIGRYAVRTALKQSY